MKLKCVYNTVFIGTKALGERDLMMEDEKRQRYEGEGEIHKESDV